MTSPSDYPPRIHAIALRLTEEIPRAYRKPKAVKVPPKPRTPGTPRRRKNPPRGEGSLPTTDPQQTLDI